MVKEGKICRGWIGFVVICYVLIFKEAFQFGDSREIVMQVENQVSIFSPILI